MQISNWRQSALFPTDTEKVSDVVFENITANAHCINYMKSLPANYVDLVVTDPPYDLVKSVITRSVKTVDYSPADGSPAEYFFDDFFTELFRILKPTGAVYVFCNSNAISLFQDLLRRHTDRLSLLTWDKTKIGMGNKTWRPQSEFIWFAENHNFKPISGNDSNILRCPVVNSNDRVHGAQKPLELLRKIISKHGEKKIVFDPFAGSGSTAIAASQTNNHYVAVELDKQRYNIMLQHINKTLGAAS